MSDTTISFLGTIQVQHGQRPVPRHAYAKVFALLAYLSVESDRPHARATLSALLWPDQPDERARHSLRQALSTLRRLLGSDGGTEVVIAHRDTIQLNPDAGIDIDVQSLMSLLDACEQHPHPRIDRCPACAQRLAQAAALVRGEFLEGFSVDDSPAFDDWVFVWRERLQRRIIPALGTLAAWHRQRGALDEAVAVIGRQLELDPWLEEAHRELMDIHWHLGNRAAALAQFERCRTVLDDELGIEPDAATTDLYNRIVASTTTPTARPDLDAQSGQLPVPSGRLVGRERERNEIADLLTRQDCRFLTLVGPGGTGKTRLAIQLAHDARDQGLADTWFVSLESIRQPGAIVRTIATELGLALPPTSNPRRELRAWLRDRSLLLVLDNVEHLVTGMDFLPALLDAAPGLKVLVTSRERLNLRGEWIYELEGLPVSGIAAHDEACSDAVELFEDRLRQVRPRMSLQPGERPIVADICRQVEGMPLAIELAAAWASTLTIEEIAGHIRQSVDFLSTSLRDVPERHRSIRVVFSQTWQMLTPDEQVTYRRLSLFRQGFTLAAAEQVAGTTAGQLAALVGKSLIVQQQPGRFRLHDLLAQYAHEMLTLEDDDVEGLNHRHAAYYLGWLAEQEEALTGHDQRMVLARIEDDFGNIQPAWMWAVRHRSTPILQGAMHPMWLYLVMRGLMREGASMFRAVVDGLDAVDDAEAAARSSWSLARASALARTGGFESGIGHFDEGIALLGEALTALQARNATREVGLCLNMLAAAHHMKGNHATSAELLEKSLDAFRAVGDRWGIGYSLNDLGLTLHLQGASDTAEKHCEQSWAMLRQVGDRRGAAFASYNLGMIAAHRGDHLRAQSLFRESLALREAGHDQWGIGASLVQLANETRELGDLEEARTHYLAALRIAWNSSVWPVVLEAMVGLATLLFDRGQVDEADAILAPIASHPSAPGQVRSRIDDLRPNLDQWPERPEPGRNADAWAAQAVNTLARALIDTPDLVLRA
ncbi:MAG TPA: tetratricopeptide repeat protein [Thermomicrobiales bacterium]|nr:tetratricopeptide repeat protein [Thermomicrobiales bacterium]